MPNRFTRQERLAEVGEAGQMRLRNGLAHAPDGAAGALAVLYLERAGVGEIRRDAGSGTAAFAHARAFRHGPARELGEGAWRALGELRRILEIDSA